MTVMRCKSTFFTVLNGTERRVRSGELLSSDDPIVKKFASSFEPVDEYVAKHRAEPVVERATAEPGEKRSVGRPRKSADLSPESAPRTAAEAKAAGVKLDDSK